MSHSVARSGHHDRDGTRSRLRRLSGGVLVTCAVVVAACGSDSEGGATKSAGSALPSTVKVPVVISLSGGAGLPGGQLADGMRFAAEEINRTKFLGNTKLELAFQDDQTNAQRVVRLVNDAVRSDAPALLGPPVSAFGLSTAPIAQKGKLPYVASQSVTSGLDPLLEDGSYIFRLTAPQTYYQQPTVDYLASKGVKTVALLAISDGAANSEWAKETMPPLLEKAGMKVTDTITFPQAQTDFAALTTRLKQNAPDAVGMSTFQTQNSTIVAQLRQAGYKGVIFADTSFGGNSLAGAGKLADGSVWTADFAPFMTEPDSAVTFIKDWTAAKHKDPLNFNAEGYDSVWFAARAIKAAGTADREKVRAAMEALTKKGFDGAVGRITFDGHDARVAGILNLWSGGKATKAAA
jgi:branched-chain amino acid transport system substrate-binding protein